MLEDDVGTPCVDEGGFIHDNRDVPLVLDKVVDEALRARRVQLSLRPLDGRSGIHVGVHGTALIEVGVLTIE